MKIIQYITVALFLTLLIGSCKKEDETVQTGINSIEEFREKYGAQLQFFTIEGEKTMFVSKAGCFIRVPYKGFIDPDTKKLVEGKLTLEFKEVLTKSDMVLTGLTTLDKENKPLESGGMFYLRVTKDGKMVDLSQGASITVYMPNKRGVNPNMKAFILNSNSQLWEENDSNEVVDTVGVLNAYQPDTPVVDTSHYYAYRVQGKIQSALIQNNKGRWYNCDANIPNLEKCNLTIHRESGTFTVLINQGFNAKQLYPSVFSYVYAIKGQKIDVISYKIENFKLYYFHKGYLIEANNVWDAKALKESSEDDFIALLKSLD